MERDISLFKSRVLFGSIFHGTWRTANDYGDEIISSRKHGNGLGGKNKSLFKNQVLIGSIYHSTWRTALDYDNKVISRRKHGI